MKEIVTEHEGTIIKYNELNDMWEFKYIKNHRAHLYKTPKLSNAKYKISELNLEYVINN